MLLFIRKGETHLEEEDYSTGACLQWVPVFIPVIAQAWGEALMGTALSSMRKGTDKRPVNKAEC